jgi:hypothetical protein
MDFAKVRAGTVPLADVLEDSRLPWSYHRFRPQFAPDMELQTARHAVHAEVARAPAAQMHHQADIRNGEEHENDNIGGVHASI